MTWDVWAGDGKAEKAELATLELAEFGVVWLAVGLVTGPLLAAAWLGLAFLVDPLFGPVPRRRPRAPLPWHA